LKISSAQERRGCFDGIRSDRHGRSNHQPTLDNWQSLNFLATAANVYSFLYLNPNITQADVDGDSNLLAAKLRSQLTLDGQRPMRHLWTADEQPAIPGSRGEINVLTSDFSAEYAALRIFVSLQARWVHLSWPAFYIIRIPRWTAWKLDDLNAKAAFVPNIFQSPIPIHISTLRMSAARLAVHTAFGKLFFFAAYERDYSIDQVKCWIPRSSSLSLHWRFFPSKRRR